MASGMKSGSRRLVGAGCGFRKETVAGTRRNERDAPKPPSWGSRCRLRYQRSAIARTDGLLGVARAEIAALYRE